MIRIKCLGGAYNGQVRTPPADMKPVLLLFEMVDQGFGWQIDFSGADREETIQWGGADLMARAYRAVKNGRVATFLGVEYKTVEELQAFEDAIVDSGYYVKVNRDDDEGLEVLIIQPE
ncbi:MAG: hypothetical protein ABI430_03035 [Candidatus Taylorbacteria bacterium]